MMLTIDFFSHLQSVGVTHFLPSGTKQKAHVLDFIFLEHIALCLWLLYDFQIYLHILYYNTLHFCVLSIAGNNVLEKSDLQPALKALKDRLMAKNVVCVYSVVV